ncbi:hypothetical protein C2E21_3635 [Chlorella sorokiniana]|uniref:Uncharacterized protein n=1 Tax=Chlorella sorokiniana TaxID=3076 RepID=A0A2P6TUA7_CHLSO|nr:hypothetical protein C2E21_3635 [Chlorella sorokiniana]|eukprot:PRW57634.1 hypothetical protein C2E21_3635 [Chlorella sorokiniana]
MDVLDALLSWLPSITDLVIYGAMASAAAAIFIISFFGIVGSFYRDTNPLLPATRALAAALTLMAPLAVFLMVAFALAESRGLYMVYTFSTARLLGSLCGTPLLLYTRLGSMSRRTGTTESGSQAAGQEEFRSPYSRPSVLNASGAERGGRRSEEGDIGLSGSGTGPMPQAMGGLTSGDLGGTGLAGMGGAAGGGAAMGDTGYHGASGVSGHAADYSGSRYGGGREQEETGLAGANGFGHSTADAGTYRDKAHASGLAAHANTGYSSGLGNVGAQGAGASAETAHFATEGKAGLYPENEHVDPYETGAAGGGGGDEAGDEP